MEILRNPVSVVVSVLGKVSFNLNSRGMFGFISREITVPGMSQVVCNTSGQILTGTGIVTRESTVIVISDDDQNVKIVLFEADSNVEKPSDAFSSRVLFDGRLAKLIADRNLLKYAQAAAVAYGYANGRRRAA